MKEIINMILDTVSEVTEISQEQIISKKRQEDISLARKLFVNICLKYGFSTTVLAKILRRSKEGIRGIYVSSFNEENRNIYKYYYKRINNKLTEINTV